MSGPPTDPEKTPKPAPPTQTPSIHTLFNPKSVPPPKGRFTRRLLILGLFALSALGVVVMQSANLPKRNESDTSAGPNGGDRPGTNQGNRKPDTTGTPEPTGSGPRLLTDPFLQLPTESSVQVVWFTDYKGTDHWVEYSDGGAIAQTVAATTTQLSRTREDSDSRVQGKAYPQVTRRPIWRHEATVNNLTSNERRSYRVMSTHASGQTATSDIFSLAPAPPKGQSLKILLTSDHQLKPMAPANLQKVVETVGQVDAVFFAGDLVNVPDRASEWFDDAEGLAFFPELQGRSQHKLNKNGTTTTYTGGRLIQSAPLFPAIGNHEVMGRYDESTQLKAQFTNTLPRDLVNQFYPAPGGETADLKWIKDHSYNIDTYQEIFSLPKTKLPNGETTEKYYAVSFGDVRLVSLYVTQVWRSPSLAPETKGRYREKASTLTQPDTWGYGQHIFEDIRKGSVQYNWLAEELNSDAFKTAKYKIVMLHHPPHTLGGNIVPAFTDPVRIENRTRDGILTSVQYEYPKDEDYIIRDLVPLLESAGVDLVFYGHSHLWNRFISEQGTHFLETSNVGNSYGAHLGDNPRTVPTDEAAQAAGDLNPFGKLYSALDDPNGLTPIVPTLAPIKDVAGNPQPFIASNDLTSFTIFETGPGTLTSYYFDTREPDSAVVKFDQFTIGQQP